MERKREITMSKMQTVKKMPKKQTVRIDSEKRMPKKPTRSAVPSSSYITGKLEKNMPENKTVKNDTKCKKPPTAVPYKPGTKGKPRKKVYDTTKTHKVVRPSRKFGQYFSLSDVHLKRFYERRREQHLKKRKPTETKEKLPENKTVKNNTKCKKPPTAVPYKPGTTGKPRKTVYDTTPIPTVVKPHLEFGQYFSLNDAHLKSYYERQKKQQLKKLKLIKKREKMSEKKTMKNDAMPSPEVSHNSYSRGKLGESLFESADEFFLDGPIMKFMKGEYNNLHDPHLKHFFNQPEKKRHLIHQGLIIKDKTVLCNQKEFTEYMHYREAFHLSCEKRLLTEQKQLLKLFIILKEKGEIPDNMSVSDMKECLIDRGMSTFRKMYKQNIEPGNKLHCDEVLWEVRQKLQLDKLEKEVMIELRTDHRFQQDKKLSETKVMTDSNLKTGKKVYETTQTHRVVRPSRKFGQYFSLSDVHLKRFYERRREQHLKKLKLNKKKEKNVLKKPVSTSDVCSSPSTIPRPTLQKISEVLDQPSSNKGRPRFSAGLTGLVKIIKRITRGSPREDTDVLTPENPRSTIQSSSPPSPLSVQCPISPKHQIQTAVLQELNKFVKEMSSPKPMMESNLMEDSELQKYTEVITLINPVVQPSTSQVESLSDPHPKTEESLPSERSKALETEAHTKNAENTVLMEMMVKDIVNEWVESEAQQKMLPRSMQTTQPGGSYLSSDTDLATNLVKAALDRVSLVISNKKPLFYDKKSDESSSGSCSSSSCSPKKSPRLAESKNVHEKTTSSKFSLEKKAILYEALQGIQQKIADGDLSGLTERNVSPEHAEAIKDLITEMMKVTSIEENVSESHSSESEVEKEKTSPEKKKKSKTPKKDFLHRIRRVMKQFFKSEKKSSKTDSTD